MAKPQFEIVEDAETPERAPLAVSAMMLALRSLSQRAVAALADLFFLATVFGAWWLWYTTPDPNTNQIVSLSVFAAFVLAANVIVRRK